MHGYKTFHEEIMNGLIENVQNGSSSNAYVFEGAKGLNKHESARLFAAALTCMSHGGSIPCGICRSCTESAANSNPDIIYVEKPKDKKTIPVDTIRGVNTDAAVKPFSAPRKVYIINEGDLLRTEAQNAFLKTFEEPPEYAVFIIVVQSASSLLPTILSRAVTVRFPRLSDELTAKILLERHPEEEKRIPFLVNFCEGIPGRAEEIINDGEFEELRGESLNVLAKIMTGGKRAAFDAEDFTEKNKEKAGKIFSFWTSYLRDILALQCGAFDRTINSDKLPALRKLSGRFDAKTTVRAAELMIEGSQMLDRYIKPSAVALRCALRINIK